MTDTDIIHRSIESIRLIDRRDLEAYMERGRILSLVLDAKPWGKGMEYNGAKTKAQFIASALNMSVSACDKNVRVYQRFSSIIPPSVTVLQSRLVKALSIPTNEHDADIVAAASDSVPDSHFKSLLHTLSGHSRPDPETCQHTSLVFLTRCKDCGKVQKDAHSPKDK